MSSYKQLILLFAACTGLVISSCNKKVDSTSVTPGTNDTATAPLNPDQQKLLDLVNQQRSNGCNCGNTYYPPVGTVTWNTMLEQAAKKHSQHMNSTNNLSHTGSNGSNPGTRISNEGYDWLSYGENIAAGYATEEDVMDAWLKSEGHCKNIMNSDFKEMGVATDGNYWTQVFGSK